MKKVMEKKDIIKNDLLKAKAVVVIEKLEVKGKENTIITTKPNGSKAVEKEELPTFDPLKKSPEITPEVVTKVAEIKDLLVMVKCHNSYSGGKPVIVNLKRHKRKLNFLKD